MTNLKDFSMFIGATSDWRKGLEEDISRRLRHKLRKATVDTFPRSISDTWISPTAREGFNNDSWKSSEGFLHKDESTFVSAIEVLDSQDESTSAPLNLVLAKLNYANKKLGQNFSATDTENAINSPEGCYLKNNAWKHCGSFRMLKDGRPWNLELEDPESGTQVSVPMLVCVMFECVIDDCD